MKSLKIGILFSISAHLLVLLILLFLRLDHQLLPDIVEVAFQAPLQPSTVNKTPQTHQARPVSVKSKSPVHPEIPIIPEPPELIDEIVLADSIFGDTLKYKSAKDILTETLSFRVKKAMLEFQIPDSLLQQADTTKTINVLMALQDVQQFEDPSAWRDRVADEMYKRNFGGPQPLSLTDLIAAGAALLTNGIIGDKKKDKKPKLTFIPTESELNVLNIVWNEEKTTQLEIYSVLDTSNTLTASQLDRVLERMVKKRLLKRKQISPRDDFTVLTPLGSFAFEKNSMNRLNRVYLYEPFIDREEMMRFLIAVRNQVLSGSDISYVSASDSTTLSKSLIHKISKIVSGKQVKK